MTGVLVPVRWRTELVQAYQYFHCHSVACGDVDPVYPVLAQVADRLRLDPDGRAWLALLHVAFYDVGSALTAYAATSGHPDSGALAPELLTLPCGTERRGHRDPTQLAAHLAAVVARAEVYGGPYAWLSAVASAGHGHEHDYPTLFAALRGVRGYGRWAGYKLCELVSHMLTPVDTSWAAVCPTDMGHAHSTGPRHGLALLTAATPAGNSATALARLDRLSDALVAHLHGAGLPATAATAETTLCDFHALYTGRYYLGHDIDQMHDQLTAGMHRAVALAFTGAGMPARLDAVYDAAWDARAAAFPPAYLGEHTGHGGVDADRRRWYRDRGGILIRAQDPPA